MDLNPILLGPYEKKRQTYGKEGHVTIEAEIRVMHLQAKEHQEYWQPLEAGSGKDGFFPRAFGGSATLPTP